MPRAGSDVVVPLRQRGAGDDLARLVALGEGIAVHHDVREVVQQLRRAVLARGELAGAAGLLSMKRVVAFPLRKSG